MGTIEERAKNYATKIVGGEVIEGDVWTAAYERYVQIATEQDRIARQEERERCVKAAIEYTCRICHPQCMPQFMNCDFNKEKCGRIARLREAMEGGKG